MSDNPADSLRRELEAVQAEVRRIIEDEDCIYSTPQQVAAVIRVVSEAAQADERERLIFALGSLDGKDFMEAPLHHRAEEAHAWAAGHDAGVEAAAALVAGGV